MGPKMRADCDPTQARKPDGAQSIRRALAVLKTLARSGDTGTTLGPIIDSTGLSRPTAHRILHVLVEEGIVEQRPGTKRYSLPGDFLTALLDQPLLAPLLKAAESQIRRVANMMGDTVYLSVLDGADMLCVARRLGSHPVQLLMMKVGRKLPLGFGVGSMAVLATMPEHERRERLIVNTDRLSSYGIDLARAMKVAGEVEARGYAMREAGLPSGTRCISVVIRATPYSPIGTLTVASTTQRIPLVQVEERVRILKGSATTIENTVRPR